jgi:hypothetical protein
MGLTRAAMEETMSCIHNLNQLGHKR